MLGIKEMSRRKVVTALRQFIEVRQPQDFGLRQVVGSALCGDGVGGSKVQHGGFSKMQ